MLRALAFASLALGCQVQGQCSSSFVEYCGTGAGGDTTCQGHIIDATHWESGPQNGNFLPYGPEQLYHLNFRDAQTGQVLSGELANAFVEVSASQKGNAPGNNWIPCGDQLCDITYDQNQSGMFVRNDTCASYFFRVVVTVIPGTSADAGTE